jgi:hypothetical protein
MKSFEELEGEFNHVLVTLVDEAQNASGSLSLKRRDTSIQLASQNHLVHVRTQNGWFELVLRWGPTTILLHKALTQRVNTRGMGASVERVETIFPNVVIFNAQNLPAPGRVKAVRFQLEKLHLFFYHQIVERHSLHDVSREVLSSLEALRNRDGAAGRGRRVHEYDLFNPRELYVVHTIDQVLEFRIQTARYIVWWGSTSRAPALQSIDLQHYPVAEVIFDEPTGIDEALDAVWAWQRFLNQLAFQELPLKAMSFGNDAAPTDAEVYIPNLVDAEAGEVRLLAGDLPLANFSDRDAFAACLEAWLEKERQRKEFRIGVNRVLEKMDAIVSVDQIVALCAALESLEEFDSISQISDAEIALLAGAAEAAALENGIAANADRLRGILKLLKHTSLPKRMKMIGKALSRHIPAEDAELIFESARQLRTSGAHGSSTEFKIQNLAPTIAGLAAMLVLFDLVTCGVPINAMGDRRILPMRKVYEVIEYLKRENAHGDPQSLQGAAHQRPK